MPSPEGPPPSPDPRRVLSERSSLPASPPPAEAGGRRLKVALALLAALALGLGVAVAVIVAEGPREVVKTSTRTTPEGAGSDYRPGRGLDPSQPIGSAAARSM